VVLFYEPDAVLHYLVYGLYHTVRRQAAILFGKVHAAPGGMHTHSYKARSLELGGYKVPAVPWEHVVVVKAGGAAVFHQLSHSCQRREGYKLLVYIFPNIVQVPEPVKQLKALHFGEVAGKLLVQMMMCVYKAGIAKHMAAIHSNVRFTVNTAADSSDKAVLAVHVRTAQYPVLPVAGHK